MIHRTPSPEGMPLADLEAACRRETRRYKGAGVSDPRFCFEIFRRALLHTLMLPDVVPTFLVPGELANRNSEAVPLYGDEAARTALVRLYTDFIKAQINRAASHPTLLEDLVQQVWLRFWRAANNGLAFHSLEAALNYLKQATISALIEDQRQARKRRRDESLQRIVTTTGEASLIDSGADLFAQHSQQRFRTRCREVLSDPLEYRVFWMRYGMALPPREIARELAGEGILFADRPPTPRAISDLLEHSCRRLRRDPEIQDLLRGD